MFAEKPRSRAIRILRQTLSDASVAGQPLPAERDLADLCSVSRTTIRLALQQLTQEGLLLPLVGRTRLVASPEVRGGVANNPVYLLGAAIDSDASRSSGWPGLIQLGAQEVLCKRGRSVLIPGTRNFEEATFGRIRQQRPAGVLIFESMFHSISDVQILCAVEAFAEVGIPSVVFGETPITCDRVCSNHEAGAHALTRWLLDQGRCRPLCLWAGPGEATWMIHRRSGFERALREAGHVPLPPEWVRWVDGYEGYAGMVLTLSGHLAPYLMADEPIDSVVALVDAHVPAICAALKRCGREPGKDVMVVGYDAAWADSLEWRLCPIPPAATVDKNNLAMGRAMAELLEDRLVGRLSPEPQLRMIEPTLQVSQPMRIS